ncbi:hypothetical protein N9N57_00025 [Flavobacteriaceae bacterium]|jgi:hypothetical protein|nr:hypothetical protein [Flavobacteriaceae bacterium]
MVRIYFIGIFVLLIAILANLTASKLELLSWYDFLKGLTNSPSFWSTLRLKDGLWLFLFYPLILGSCALLGDLLFSKILNL